MVRKSTRARKPTSYTTAHAQKDLDDIDAPAPPSPPPPPPPEAEEGESTTDEDDEFRDDDDDDDDDDVAQDAEDSSSGDEDDDVDSSGGYGQQRTSHANLKKGKKSAATTLAATGTTRVQFARRVRADDGGNDGDDGGDDDEAVGASLAHRPHVRTVDSGKKGKGKKRERLLAEGASANALRAPDPTVRLAYRPGIAKASGKMDRLVQVFGCGEAMIKKGLWVRDTYLALPAVPEKASLALSPFWGSAEAGEGAEGGEGGEGMGDGAQKVEVLRFQDVEGYLGRAEDRDELLRVVVGKVGKYEKVVFKRFGIYGLAKVGEDKKGFLLNAGAQVLSMDWATNRPHGTQYLAISTLTDGLPTCEPPQELQPPAFSRLPSKSNIQIWRFRPGAADSSPSREPSLALVLCHDWGPARGLRWCPSRLASSDSLVLGHLAAVFADGCARVLRVILPHADDDLTATDADGCDFLKYAAPVFECFLPDDIVTAVSWISPTSLAAGCASGSIAAWDATAGSIPYLYTPLHDTYITGLSTCFPSFPHHVITSSMDGYSRLTALASPDADTVPNNRSRIAPAAIAYVDAIQAGVSVEEGAWVKFFPLRRYFSATTVCKQPGIVRALAASFLHTLVLSGGTDGEAIFSNPARRAFHSKVKNYQQTWFQLEFSDAASGEPLVRMTEGFRLEECEGKSRVKGSQQLLTTVYPLQVGIGAVCWNQNLAFGGWAAAGASCGLVRVEDVAIKGEERKEG